MKRVVEYLATLLVIALSAAIFLPSFFRSRITEPKVSMVYSEMTCFLLAMQSYQSLYGHYPTTNESNILQPLLGDNPRGTPLLSLRAHSTNSIGQFIDPWGTPYYIKIGTNVVIRSAGPNRAFGDKDDILHVD